jgi:hypothetical protein
MGDKATTNRGCKTLREQAWMEGMTQPVALSVSFEFSASSFL